LSELEEEDRRFVNAFLLEKVKEIRGFLEERGYICKGLVFESAEGDFRLVVWVEGKEG